jgi:hypothetical protein
MAKRHKNCACFCTYVIMEVWRNCQVLSQQTSGLIFHISIRIHEDLLYIQKHVRDFQEKVILIIRDFWITRPVQNATLAQVVCDEASDPGQLQRNISCYHITKNKAILTISQDVILEMNGPQEWSSETPYAWSSSEPCEISKPLVRLHEDKRKCLYQKQVSVPLRNKLHYFQHSCIAGVYNAPDVIPEWKGLTAYCRDVMRK